VDAICAVKILQCILRFDNIIYVLVPIKTITDLKNAFEEQKVDVSSILNVFVSFYFTFINFNFSIGETCSINQLWWYIGYNRNIRT